jgi:hypothetical protein
MTPSEGRRGGEDAVKTKLAIAGVVLSIVTALVTYTVTITQLFADMRQEQALQGQRFDYSQRELQDLQQRVRDLERGRRPE